MRADLRGQLGEEHVAPARIVDEPLDGLGLLPGRQRGEVLAGQVVEYHPVQEGHGPGSA